MIRYLTFSLAFVGAGMAFVGCAGGLEFNGTDNSDRINPRTTPIRPFALPIEAYNPLESEYQIDRATVLFGRQVAGAPGGAVQFAHPATDAMPQNPTAFVFKAGTDIWEITGDVDRFPTPIPNGIADVADAYGAPTSMNPNQAVAGMISVVCQFMAQNVDGTPRSDTPFTYDNVEIESIPITIFNSNGIASAALSATRNRQQRPVDARIGPFGALQPGEDVVSQNKNAVLQPVSSPGRTNEISLGIVGSPFTMAAWLEAPQENLFIESNWSFPGVLDGVPVTAFFNMFGLGSLPGGVYVNRTRIPFNPTYEPNLDISFYHNGVLISHAIGRGVGIPSVAFIRPGVSSRQEDIMNASVLLDIVFFQTAGRRMQFTPEAFLVMRNTSSLPIGSAARFEAVDRSLQDPFHPQGINMRETLPGPKR
jgi:hypothetical protein